MEPEVYAVEAELERHHWWFVGRHRLFGRIADRYAGGRDARVLDIGTSTGGSLRHLRERGYRNVVGTDASPEAVRFCEERGLGPIHLCDVCSLPFDDDRFDFALATDIIEHVDDDAAALREITRVIRPGGHILVTVPAFPVLWSRQDDIAHHKRRYRMPGLRRRLSEAGLEIIQSYYFNYLLFLPILVVRKVCGALGIHVENENAMTTGAVNTLLQYVFEADIRTARYLHPPFGVSILAVARRPGND